MQHFKKLPQQWNILRKFVKFRHSSFLTVAFADFHVQGKTLVRGEIPLFLEKMSSPGERKKQQQKDYQTKTWISIFWNSNLGMIFQLFSIHTFGGLPELTCWIFIFFLHFASFLTAIRSPPILQAMQLVGVKFGIIAPPYGYKNNAHRKKHLIFLCICSERNVPLFQQPPSKPLCFRTKNRFGLACLCLIACRQVMWGLPRLRVFGLASWGPNSFLHQGWWAYNLVIPLGYTIRFWIKNPQ